MWVFNLIERMQIAIYISDWQLCGMKYEFLSTFPPIASCEKFLNAFFSMHSHFEFVHLFLLLISLIIGSNTNLILLCLWQCLYPSISFISQFIICRNIVTWTFLTGFCTECPLQKELALYTASKINSEFCWFDVDGDIDPLFKVI